MNQGLAEEREQSASMAEEPSLLSKPLTVAWCSYFPVEWLDGAPEIIRNLPKRHPACWLSSCADELKQVSNLKLHVIELSKHLPRDIHFECEGVSFHCVKTPGGFRAPSMFWLDTLLIRKQLKRIKPDVVHAWGSEKGAILVASRLSYPHLVSVQGLLEYYNQLVPPSAYERLLARLERVSLRRARVASGESVFVTSWLRNHYPHLEVHHVEHSPSAAFYNIDRRPETDPARFVAVGRLGFRKGTDLLLLALDSLKEQIPFRVTLMGSSDPGFLPRVRARTSAALWERVDLVPQSESGAVRGLLSRATFALYPTRADTGPVAAKEAAIAGVPLIGSRMGGIPDYVIPGKNGFMCPPGDLSAFTGAVREALQHPLFRRGVVDLETLARVRDHLSPKRMAQGFLRIYRRLGQS